MCWLVAGDQYGNYLIQWILMNSATHQREVVATHIRYVHVHLFAFVSGSNVIHTVNIWSLCVVPSSVPALQCFAATLAMLLVQAQEQESRLTASRTPEERIAFLEANLPDDSIVVANGAPTTHHFVDHI